MSTEPLRLKFEAWIGQPPFEKPLNRYPADSNAWPGQYVDYPTQLAWEAYQAATLSQTLEPRKILDSNGKHHIIVQGCRAPD